MNILLGITGGVAAYKTVELVRLWRKAGHEVQVVMTANALNFVAPLSLQSVSGRVARHELFDPQAEAAMGHIELARWAEQIVIAPASANFIAKLAHGLADDLLTTLCLATSVPISLAPAMNQAMWHHAATTANLAILQQRGIEVLGPAHGEQACGDIGLGRMLEPSLIAAALTPEPLFTADCHIAITAGPTREALDPVRFLSNPSSGKMGFALARAAKNLGASVSLIAGPNHLTPPTGIQYIEVESALDMQQACLNLVAQTPIAVFIGAAAVANYRPAHYTAQKLPGHREELHLNLVRNPDIITAMAQHDACRFTVGFAAQTDDVINQARAKMQRKGLDMIIANQVGKTLAQGFASDDNSVHVLWGEQQVDFPSQSKQQLAPQVLRLIKDVYDERTTTHSS